MRIPSCAAGLLLVVGLVFLALFRHASELSASSVALKELVAALRANESALLASEAMLRREVANWRADPDVADIDETVVKCGGGGGLIVPATISSTRIQSLNGCLHSPDCAHRAACRQALWRPNSSCPRVPRALLRRGYEPGTGPVHASTMRNLRERIQTIRCQLARGEPIDKLRVLVLGGSVTAGSFNNNGAAQWWAARRFLALLAVSHPELQLHRAGGQFAVPLSEIVQVYASPTSGSGPDFVAYCLNHHTKLGRLDMDPDVAILEFAVNDFGGDHVSAGHQGMAALVKVLLERGSVVLMLHHYGPKWLPGSDIYVHPNPAYHETAEYKHTAVAKRFGVPFASLAHATGLGFRERWPSLGTDSPWVLHPCALVCSFHRGDNLKLLPADGHHPAGCGHSLLAQLAALALGETLIEASQGMDGWTSRATKTPISSSQCRPEPRRCHQITLNENASGPAGPAHKRSCSRVDASVFCHSMTGPPEEWDLWPVDYDTATHTSPSGWKLYDMYTGMPFTGTERIGGMLPSSRYTADRGGGVNRNYKWLWEGREVNSTARFRINCSTAATTLRITHIVSSRLQLGWVRVSIDGHPTSECHAQADKFTLFVPKNVLIPQPLLRMRQHEVALTILPDRHTPHDANSSEPKPKPGEFKGMGFGINSISCF